MLVELMKMLNLVVVVKMMTWQMKMSKNRKTFVDVEMNFEKNFDTTFVTTFEMNFGMNFVKNFGMNFETKVVNVVIVMMIVMLFVLVVVKCHVAFSFVELVDFCVFHLLHNSRQIVLLVFHRFYLIGQNLMTCHFLIVLIGQFLRI